MAFDATDPADLAALKSEEINDPIGIGYLHDGDEKTLLDQFNNSDLNVGGEVSGPLLTVQILFDTMTPSDFGGNQVGNGEDMWMRALLAHLQTDPRLIIEQYRTKIFDIATGNSTQNDIEALSMPISRAEVLFGVGTKISKGDWRSARDS